MELLYRILFAAYLILWTSGMTVVLMKNAYQRRLLFFDLHSLATILYVVLFPEHAYRFISIQTMAVAFSIQQSNAKHGDIILADMVRSKFAKNRQMNSAALNK